MRLILILFAAIMFLSIPVYAIESFNETFSFNGGGIVYDATTTVVASNIGGKSNDGALSHLKLNFDSIKVLSTVKYHAVASRGYLINYHIASSGFMQKYVPFTAYVNGKVYGSGTIGWERTQLIIGETEFRYVIYFETVNATYANSLTGWQYITLEYDHTVFDLVTNTGTGTDIYAEATNTNFLKMYTNTTNGYMGIMVKGATDDQYISYVFTDNGRLTFNNTSATFGYVNLTRNAYGMRLLLTNESGGIMYDITSTSDVSIYTKITGGVISHIYDTAAADWYNRTLYSISGPLPPVEGNISLDKHVYNRSEIVPIKFNISDSGRIDIESATTQTIYPVSAGLDQTYNYYIPSDAPFDNYTVYLQYYDGLTWNYINHTYFTVTSIGYNNIEFSKPTKTYVSGETITINAIGIDSGYVRLNDSNNNTKFNFSITANTLTPYYYYISNTDPSGVWYATLYDSTQTAVASDMAEVYNIPGSTVTPTITATASPGATVDYVTNLTARKSQENRFLNFYYSNMVGLFSLAVLATMMFFLKKIRW